MSETGTIRHLRTVPPSGPSEEDVEEVLVRRAKDGDGRAWARIYQRHFDRIYRDLYYQLGDAAAADELVQETFARALVSLERFDGRSSLSTWLRGVGQNLVRKHWRSHSRRARAYERFAQTHPESTPASHGPEELHVRDARAKVLADALETLPASLREVFVLRDVQGVSVEDTAERLGITPGNVRVRANRARTKLRGELVRLGWLEEGSK